MLKLPALGIDTSNYTTSAAVLDSAGMDSQTKLLPVREGELGLRQSDAVFHHTRQLPEVMGALGEKLSTVRAVGVSDRPRGTADSYMPCFLVGVGAAKMLAQALRVPLYTFSHQQGHIAAALYNTGRLDLLQERFLAFHLSGGTTEAVLVTPGGDKLFSAECVARSLDVKAGQVIDRIGVMLGLPFPAGKHLDPLAASYTARVKVRASMRGADCSLSGVENKCRAMKEQGASDAKIAATCIAYVTAAVDGMCAALRAEYGALPIVFSGGVSSNTTMRAVLSEKYGAIFAEPRFSADNAAGIAVLAAMMEGAT